MSKNVTRSTVNEQQYSAQQFLTSGFPLSHTRYSSYMLGRLHISGYQDIVAGDKISGKNDGNFTFNRIVTPFVSPVDGLQYNFYLPFRTLDRTFERAFAPNKRNAMSKDWSTPTVNTRYLVKKIFETYYGADYSAESYQSFSQLFSQIGDENITIEEVLGTQYTRAFYQAGIVDVAVSSLREGAFHEMAKKMYIDDALIDIADNIESKLGTAENPISGDLLVQDVAYNILDCLLTPFVGRYSYYGELKYKYLRPNDLYRISRGVAVPSYGDMQSFYDIFDDTPQCEYALRAMYVVWYEYFRNVNLEEETDNLPYWRDFGSTSIFDLDAGGNLCYLVYRIRPWYEDMFINAQVDDMSRHVYAPIINGSGENISLHTESFNNLDTNIGGVDYIDGLPKPHIYTLGWLNQMTGENVVMQCPVPANINDILADSDTSFYEVYGLDLNTLRQSKQLEQYLKRNYLFGDEYKDRMLAHYNSRVSDMRVNRPELLSQSINASNMNQEVSNVSTDETKVGDRTATMTITTGGDQFTTYCEEFGIVLHIVSFMPQAVYDGIHPQLLATKHIHYPLPEFATNNEEFGRKMEIADSALSATLIGENGSDNRFMFGRYMAYHAWRARVDEVGGQFLDELQECTFRRFWGLFSDDTTPKLNYYFLHCRPQLGMFANTNRYDTQLYGNTHHEFFVERVLPTPVEKI